MRERKVLPLQQRVNYTQEEEGKSGGSSWWVIFSSCADNGLGSGVFLKVSRDRRLPLGKCEDQGQCELCL